MKKWWLYVLKLEQGKYYVGITSKTPEVRFKQHQNGFLAAGWTKKYTPLKIMDKKYLGPMTEAQAKKYENKVVRLYMKEKGTNNVRGGDLTDNEDYIRRFGRLFTKEQWEPIVVVTLLTIIVVALLLTLK